MDSKVLIAFPSGDGPSRAVAEAIAEGLADAAIAADVVPEDGVTELTPYSAVILGAPLHAEGTRELARFGPGRLPLAIFALEPPGLDDRSRTAALAGLDRALDDAPWLDPLAIEVFTTALLWEPATPLAHVPAIDLCDRDAIRCWAHRLPGLLGLRVPVG